MKKKLVKILGISYSQSQMGSYVVVLSEVKGKTKLPLIIKPSDAQQIALKIEGIKPQRPLTHDIFKSMTDSFGIDVQEIYIHSVLEGIFYTKIIASNGLDEVEIECVAGDGISLSLVYDCPIYVSQSVLDNAGISINNDGSSFDMGEEDIDDIEEEPKRVVSIEDLEKMMEGALANEEYEIAAELRDRIQTLKDEIK
jgi:bifunctional DNase/RNase